MPGAPNLTSLSQPFNTHRWVGDFGSLTSFSHVLGITPSPHALLCRMALKMVLLLLCLRQVRAVSPLWVARMVNSSPLHLGSRSGARRGSVGPQGGLEILSPSSLIQTSFLEKLGEMLECCAWRRCFGWRVVSCQWGGSGSVRPAREVRGCSSLVLAGVRPFL